MKRWTIIFISLISIICLVTLFPFVFMFFTSEKGYVTPNRFQMPPIAGFNKKNYIDLSDKYIRNDEKLKYSQKLYIESFGVTEMVVTCDNAHQPQLVLYDKRFDAKFHKIDQEGRITGHINYWGDDLGRSYEISIADDYILSPHGYLSWLIDDDETIKPYQTVNIDLPLSNEALVAEKKVLDQKGTLIDVHSQRDNASDNYDDKIFTLTYLYENQLTQLRYASAEHPNVNSLSLMRKRSDCTQDIIEADHNVQLKIDEVEEPLDYQVAIDWVEFQGFIKGQLGFNNRRGHYGKVYATLIINGIPLKIKYPFEGFRDDFISLDGTRWFNKSDMQAIESFNLLIINIKGDRHLILPNPKEGAP